MTDYMIIERDGCKYVANVDGDILYEATNLTNSRIAAMVRNKEYVDWRRYSLAADVPNTRGMGQNRKLNTGRWFEEGDFIFDVLKKHPKRTYADCVLMATMEGLYIDASGILRKVTQ